MNRCRISSSNSRTYCFNDVVFMVSFPDTDISPPPTQIWCIKFREACEWFTKTTHIIQVPTYLDVPGDESQGTM